MLVNLLIKDVIISFIKNFSNEKCSQQLNEKYEIKTRTKKTIPHGLSQ
jgi:hypothetical protein